MATPSSTRRRDDLDDDAPPRRPGMPVDSARLIPALIRGRWILIGSIIAGLLVGFLYAKLVIKSEYKAFAIVKYDGHVGDDGNIAPPAPGELEAVHDLMRIDEVLTQLKERLRLEGNLSRVFGMTEVEYNTATNHIRVYGKSASPVQAARIANTLIEAFLEYQQRSTTRRFSEELRAVERRLAGAHLAREDAQRRYDAFRREHGITSLTTEQTSAISRATDARTQAELVGVEIRSLEARVTALERELQNAPRTQAVSSTSINPDRQALVTLQSERASLGARLSDQHPRIQDLDRRIAALRGRIASGQSTSLTQSVVGANANYQTIAAALAAAQADLSAARQRQIDLTSVADAARTRVSEFSAVEGEALGLAAEVDVATRLATDLESQRGRVRNARERAQSGMTWVMRARPPDFPEKNTKKIVYAFSILTLFLLGGLGYVLYGELRGFHVFTAREVAFWGNGPVVGTSTWPRETHAITQLVADLDDRIPDATGTMLVVGANRDAQVLAREIAIELNADARDTTVVELGAPMQDRDGFMVPSRTGKTLPPPVPTHLDGAPAGVRLLPPPRAVSERPAPERPASARPPSIPAPSAAPGVGIDLVRSSPLARGVTPHDREAPLHAEAWLGDDVGQGLRRAARLAGRVLVIVPAGRTTVAHLTNIRTRLGRADAIGFLVVDLPPNYVGLPDRIGPVDEFWRAERA